jgi:hypothetical protein
VEGEVVVVLYRLERDLFAEQAQVVDWDWGWEEVV